MAAWILLSPLLANAIVNVEAVQTGAPRRGWTGNVAASLGGTAGNSNTFRARVDTRLQYHRRRHTDFVVLSYDYGKSRGRTNNNRRFLHLRHRLRLTTAWAVEAFGQAEQNEFARLSFRGLAGGGLRRTLAQSPLVAAHLGLGAMFERELLKQAVDTSDALRQSRGRINSYLNIRAHLNAHTLFSGTAFFQPALTDPGDFRLLAEAELHVRMTAGIHLRLDLEVQHDNRPPQRVKKTDVIYTTGIEIPF